MRSLRIPQLLSSLLCLFGLLWALATSAQQEAQTLLLVAHPQLRDPFFSESVVLVTRHGRSRPMGVILNKPSSIRLDSSGGEQYEELVIYSGGPVSPQAIVSLFRSNESLEGRRDLLSLGNGMFMGMGESILKEMLSRKQNLDLKVFAGVSVWNHGQLENEIARGDWLTMPFDPDVALKGSASRMWQEMLARASQRHI